MPSVAEVNAHIAMWLPKPKAALDRVPMIALLMGEEPMDRHTTSAASLTPPQFAPAEWAQIVHTLRLSPQQAKIVALILQGHRDKQIACDLGLSAATVRSHLRCIFARIDVRDRVELVLRVFATSEQTVVHHQN